MDWETAILQGLFTGIGVIIAQRIVKYIDEHTLTRKIKKEIDKITFNRKDNYYDK